MAAALWSSASRKTKTFEKSVREELDDFFKDVIQPELNSSLSQQTVDLQHFIQHLIHEPSEKSYGKPMPNDARASTWQHFVSDKDKAQGPHSRFSTVATWHRQLSQEKDFKMTFRAYHPEDENRRISIQGPHIKFPTRRRNSASATEHQAISMVDGIGVLANGRHSALVRRMPEDFDPTSPISSSPSTSARQNMTPGPSQQDREEDQPQTPSTPLTPQSKSRAGEFRVRTVSSPCPPMLAPPPSRPRTLLSKATVSFEDHVSQEEEPLMASSTLDVKVEENLAEDADTEELGSNRWVAAEAFLERPCFEHLVCGLVLVNAAMLGMELNYQALHRGVGTPYVMHIGEYVFLFLFTLELLSRMVVYGARFFSWHSSAWNIFDLFVVSMQLLEQVMLHLLPYFKGQLSMAALRMIRLLRLFRITRLVRVLRVVEELRTLVGSIVSSAKALSFSILLFAMVTYTFSLIFLELVNQSVDEEDVQHAAVIAYFGSLGRTVLTLYESILGGLSWDVAHSALISDVSLLSSLLFTLYVAVCVFALMNVVTGVFVEKAMSLAQEDRNLYMAMHIRDLFMKTEDGELEDITWDLFESKLSCPDMRDYFKTINVDPSEAQGLFYLLDKDCTGAVDSVELVDGLLRLRGSAKSLDLALLMHETDTLAKHFKQHASEVEQSLTVITGNLMQLMESKHEVH